MQNDLAYIALPYSGNPDETEDRVKKMAIFDAVCMNNGMFAVSPVYKHLMRKYDVILPGNWAYWKEYSEVLLSKCNLLIVMCIPGWRESEGVQAEIKIAEGLRIRIFYVAEVGDSFTELHPTISALERSINRTV
jgi:hypothetical protein